MVFFSAKLLVQTNKNDVLALPVTWAADVEVLRCGLVQRSRASVLVTEAAIPSIGRGYLSITPRIGGACVTQAIGLLGCSGNEHYYCSYVCLFFYYSSCKWQDLVGSIMRMGVAGVA